MILFCAQIFFVVMFRSARCLPRRHVSGWSGAVRVFGKRDHLHRQFVRAFSQTKTPEQGQITDRVAHLNHDQLGAFEAKQRTIIEAHHLLEDSRYQVNSTVDSYVIKEPSLFKSYFRGSIIILNGTVLWSSFFGLLGVGSYQILGELAGIDVTAFPLGPLGFSVLIGAILGGSRGVLSAVEFGLLQVNILKSLTRSFIDYTLPSEPSSTKDTPVYDIQETFGADQMKKWLTTRMPLDTYRRYLIPVWHKNNLVAELLHHIEPNLHSVDLVLDIHNAPPELVDKDLLVSLIYPHIEVALFHLVQVKKKRATFFAFTVLCLTTSTLLFSEILKEHLPVACKFVRIYDQLKEDGVIASNHPVKAYARDSLIATLGLVVYIIEHYGAPKRHN